MLLPPRPLPIPDLRLRLGPQTGGNPARPLPTSVRTGPVDDEPTVDS